FRGRLAASVCVFTDSYGISSRSSFNSKGNDMVFLEIQNLDFSYHPSVSLLKDINLSLKKGQIGALLGSSGSGKTSLLRCIAGFETATRGRIRMSDVNLFSARGFQDSSSATESLPPSQRRIGYLFQSLALFPHLTVAQNIKYGLSDW